MNLKLGSNWLRLVSIMLTVTTVIRADQPRIPTIYIFGDSHAQYNFTAQRVWQEDNIFTANVNKLNISKLKVAFKIRSFSGKSMYRLGLEGLSFLNIVNYDVQSGDIVLFNFGDMDCRWHILKQCALQQKTPAELIAPLIEGYFAAILANQQQVSGVICAVMSVVPPCCPCSVDPLNNPACYGSLEQRLAVTRAMNAGLAQKCAKLGLLFIDTYDVYSASNGQLPVELSDGNMHVNAKFNDALKERVVQILFERHMVAF